jgi:hypothetical protein
MLDNDLSLATLIHSCWNHSSLNIAEISLTFPIPAFPDIYQLLFSILYKTVSLMNAYAIFSENCYWDRNNLLLNIQIKKNAAQWNIELLKMSSIIQIDHHHLQFNSTISALYLLITCGHKHAYSSTKLFVEILPFLFRLRLVKSIESREMNLLDATGMWQSFFLGCSPDWGIERWSNVFYLLLSKDKIDFETLC